MTYIDAQPPLWRATKTQFRVIYAMFLRDLLSQVGGKLMPTIMLFVRPGILVGLMYVVYHGHTPQGMSLLAFITTGWLSYFTFIRTFNTFSSRGAPVLLFPQITTLDIMLTNLVTEWFIYTIIFIVFCSAALLIERSPLPANPLQVVLAFWSIEVFGSLLGIIMSSLARVLPVVDNFTIVYRRLAAFVSGVAVTAADTPYPVLKYLAWSPLFQCIELEREAWWPAYVSPIADPWYVATVLFFMAAFGLAIERFTRRFMN